MVRNIKCMSTYVIAFSVFLISVLAMAVGVMITGRRIQGSCGGLANAVTNERGEKVCGYCGLTADQQKVEGCADADVR